MQNKLLCKLPAAERKKMTELVEVSQPLLKLILERCSEDIKKLGETTEADFDSPSWAFKRAYRDGLIKGLTMLQDYVIIRS